MEEKAKDIWSQVKGTVGRLSKTVKAIIVGVIVAGLVALAVFLANNSKIEYEALFTDLSSSDMAAVTKYLTDEGITDILIRGDDTIMMPAGQEAQLKAKLIAADYPQSSPDYGLYMTNISSLSTESDRSQMALYKLMDRMAATIRCYDGGAEAVVNIAPGEDRRYVLSQDNTSLFLFMVVFVVFVLLSRSRRRLQHIEPVVVTAPELEELPVKEPVEEPLPGGVDIVDVHTEKSMELRGRMHELADSNPEIAAQAIKTLLRGDEGANGG